MEKTRKSVGRRIAPALKPSSRGNNRNSWVPDVAVFKSLLVPVDFSDTSAKALAYATSLAQEFGSRLRLLHVLEPSAVLNSANPAFGNWDLQVKEAARNRLVQLADDKIEESVPVATDIRVGRAHKVICEAAKTQRSDLIVIGTHGFTGLKHLFLGSTAERVIRHAPCSVLAVRRGSMRKQRGALRFKRILVPTDFSKPAEQALSFAALLAQRFGALVQLLYVVPIYYAGGDYDMTDYAMLEAEQKESGQKKLHALGQKIVKQDISVTSEVRQGRPAVEINEFAAETNCDLIVVSTHGRTGWEHALLGSTTEELVRHASCPVLVVRKYETTKS